MLGRLTIARDNNQPGVSVILDRADERPVRVLRVLEDRTSVVADHRREPVVHPGLNHIGVVKTGNRRGNQTGRREASRRGNAHLVHPVLVELNLTLGIGIGCAVELLVAKGVRHVGKGVELGRVGEPRGKLVKLRARRGPVVRREILGPEVGAGPGLLDKLELRLGDIARQNDGLVRIANPLRHARVDGGDDVTVAVVAKLEKELGAGGQTRVEVGLPGNVLVEVSGCNLEAGAGGGVNVRLELEVIYLCAQVNLALADD